RSDGWIMRHFIGAAVASVGIVNFLAGPAALAQTARPLPPQAGSSPGISPYLNLLRGGLPAVNYYGIVRPQQQYNLALSSLEQQVALSRVAQTAAEAQTLP